MNIEECKKMELNYGRTKLGSPTEFILAEGWRPEESKARCF